MQGAGVAVTPFLSILRQLVREYEMSRCTRCQKVGDKPLFIPQYGMPVSAEQPPVAMHVAIQQEVLPMESL